MSMNRKYAKGCRRGVKGQTEYSLVILPVI